MNIIIRPLVTEKMTLLSEKQRKYGFVVSKTANKIQIKAAVEKAYNVTIEAVNTLVVPGKTKVRQTKKGVTVGGKSSYKKAYVTVSKNDTIDFYGNI
jgi:large subunit ribosomal protein L23